MWPAAECSAGNTTLLLIQGRNRRFFTLRNAGSVFTIGNKAYYAGGPGIMRSNGWIYRERWQFEPLQ